MEINISCIGSFESVLSKILAPFLVSVLTYFVFGKMDDLRKRKRDSKLGVAVMKTLKEEIERGLKEMSRVFELIKKDSNLDSSSTSFNYLPKKTWAGISTIDNDILIRILEVFKDRKNGGFPASEIRTHTKNYFEYMVENWNSSVKAVMHSGKKVIDLYDYANYPEAASGLISMLDDIIKSLEHNSSKLWPN
jgi:hypothetical protein